jgi:hypothetical protein
VELQAAATSAITVTASTAGRRRGRAGTRGLYARRLGATVPDPRDAARRTGFGHER